MISYPGNEFWRCWTLLTFLLLALPGGEAFAATGVSSITSAGFLLSDDTTPPADDQSWGETTFVGATRLGNKTGDQQIWYRFELDPPAALAGDIYSLYFWRYNLSIRVFMNGNELGGDTFREGYQTVSWNRSQLLDIRADQWQPGPNVFHVRFNPSKFGGTFSDIKFGRKAVLQPIAEEMQFWKIQVNSYLLLIALVTSASAFLLWLFRRRDTVYLWFSGVAISWSLVLTHMTIYYNPVPYHIWLPAVHMAVDSWIFLVFGFVSRLLGLENRAARAVMTVLWILALVSHAFSPREYFWMLAYSFHLLLTLGMLVLFLGVLVRAVSDRDRLAMAVVAAVLGQIVLSFHDYWLFFAAESEEWETATHFSQFGVPLILIVFLFILLRRFTSALEQSERLNEELESRVEATRAELEKSFSQRHELELDQVAARERQVIFRDLHDDVGSKLLSILHDTDAARVSAVATSALESLREAIYRTNYRDEKFLEFLSSMREEAKLRTSGQGFHCEWYEDPDLDNDIIDSKQCYHLNRIVREAITNCLAHSGGSRISISIELQENRPGWLSIEIEDDGIGGVIPAESRSAGIRNISERAAQIGAESAWGKGAEGGTRFSLQFRPSVVEATPDAYQSGVD